jgi:hypothetical protein
MRNKLIKVDRVQSVAEALAIEDLGADLIGVALDPDPRFADVRVVSAEQAIEIAGVLRRARLVVELDVRDDPAQAIRTARSVGARYLQPLAATVFPAGVSTDGLHLVYAGIEISHDDDPGWVFTRYPEAALFQIQVLPEYRNAWAMLRDEAPAYPDDEFQIDDLNALGRARDVVVTLDFTPGNVTEILTSLPGVRGIALTLADHTTRADLHTLRFPEAVEVLRASAAGQG